MGISINELLAKVSNGKVPVVSLFCGAGGLDLGFSKVGFIPVIAIDSDKSACDTYRHNHPHTVVIQADLASVTGSFIANEIRTLPKSLQPKGVLGGPPCQAFSLGNTHKNSNDSRLELPQKYSAILRSLNNAFDLDFFVFENVLGLRYNHNAMFLQFKKLFARAGFHIFEGELDAKDFGVAQVRRRVFIVGLNMQSFPHIHFDFPTPCSHPVKTVRDTIENLPTPTVFDRRLSKGRIPYHQNHWCMSPRSPKFFDGSLKPGKLKGRPFRVLAWDRPSWTVAYGHREVHVHPCGRRRLSVFEAMLLQGFPKSYELCGTLSDQIRLVSDAVSPPVAAALGRKIKMTLEKYSSITASDLRVNQRTAEKERIAYQLFCMGRNLASEHQPPRALKRFFVNFARKSSRRFPWRSRNVSSFQLLLAEMLLLQTKAEDVARVWPSVVQSFGTPKKLAAAGVDGLTELLRPLGLQNQRAKALKAMADCLLTRHQGNVPRSFSALLRLPYVGIYAAAAVASLKFGERMPIVDANVLRVLSRISGTDFGKDLRRSPAIWSYAWRILPRHSWEQHNYGLLDFAALICTARRPHCENCALRRICFFAKTVNQKNRAHAAA